VRFFEAQGYAAEKLFNAIHSATRLIFTDTRTGRPVDVILDRFTMCHTIDLRDRFELDDTTLPLADLLLTKLQIVQLNEKDVLDIHALLADHEVDPSENPEAIDLRRITALTADDWGLEHTIRRTLAEARERSKRVGASEGVVQTIEDRIEALVTGLDSSPRTSSGGCAHGSANGSAGISSRRNPAADRVGSADRQGRATSVSPIAGLSSALRRRPGACLISEARKTGGNDDERCAGWLGGT
jgi:hypothetical protein